MPEIMQEHREDGFRNTRTTELGIDDYSLRKYSAQKLGLMTPPRGFRKPGCVGVIDISPPGVYIEGRDPKTDDPTVPNITRSTGWRGTYHPEAPLFISPRQSCRTIDYYDIYPTRTSLRDDGWPTTNFNDIDNVYNLLPDYVEADAETLEPSDVSDDQTGLTQFESVTQAQQNPAALDADDRIEDLPLYLPDDHDQAIKDKQDPTTGALDECDHCHSEEPWHSPLERGIDAVRPGGIEDGSPDHDTCDDPKKCDCCVCPRCHGTSTPARTTMTPRHRCNNCELEFEHPVDGTLDDDAKRARLFWRCSECGAATRAPFGGVPEDLLFE